MSYSKSEADVIFNRANLALAKSQRLVASWLPPKSAEENAADSLPEHQAVDADQNESEVFHVAPEQLGLGAAVPKDASFNNLSISSHDKLRKQLLGKDFQREFQNQLRSRGRGQPQIIAPVGSKPLPRNAAQSANVDTDSEEDTGRSALGRGKRTKRDTPTDTEKSKVADLPERVGHGTKTSGGQSPAGGQVSRGKKKPSYLDEVLASRSKGRKRAMI